MRRSTLQSIFQFVISAVLVFLIVFIYTRVIRVNPTTVALTFLVAVLAVSAAWGLRTAVFISMVATLAFNYFFLEPVGKFTIADPQNWVALFAFLFTAVIASQLSARVRREADEANQRRHEVEKLYAFSQQLLVTDNVLGLLNELPHHVVATFGVNAAAVFVSEREKIYRSGPDISQLQGEELRNVAFPVMLLFKVSVAVMVWLPEVFSVAKKLPVPLVKVESEGSTAAGSELVK